MSKNEQWTDDQKKAIDHRDGGAIITAGAGSGKTAVLSAHITDILCDEEHYTDPSKTAVITFTKKAANELKARLKRKMRERLAENPENAEFLRRQNTLLHNAKISTISSFCFTLIRENITLSTLASGFEIMEESRAAMTRYAIAEMAVEEFYKNSQEKDRELILEHFVHKSDRPLIEAILSISSFASNLPEPDVWYERCKDPSRLDDIFACSDDGYNSTREELLQCCEEISKALELLNAVEKPKAAQVRAKECIEKLLSLCESAVATLDKAVSENDFSNVSFIDKKEIKNAIPPFTKDKVGDASASIKAAVESLALLYENASYTKGMRSSLYKSQPVIDILIDITRRFEQLYAAEKQSLNVADYTDAERQLYNMLKNNPDLREKIGLQLIIVDEFQDSNRLQYEIFEMLSDNKKNLYFVGDIKQSIYAFRGAQSEVFDEVTKNPQYTCLNLNHNFRSRDNVIKGVNEIFSHVMTEKLGGVNYAENSLLKLGDTQNKSDNPEDITEILLVTDDNEEYPEAKYVAYHINEMIKSGYTVEGRPCTAEDFAIILRATSDKASHYADALAEYDISSTTKKDGGFFSEPEICIMLDYLKVIDDPYNDESLARLLMSCLMGFSADKMAAIRTCTIGFDIAEISAVCGDELKAYAGYWRKKPLYSCIKAATDGYEINKELYPSLSELCNEKPQLFGSMTDKECTEFETQLDRLRGVMAASSPAELIKYIYDTTSVADLLSVGENGENRRANLAGLLTIASDYVRHHSDGILSDLLSHLMQVSDRGLKVVLPSGGASAGVQIMSIHASKGLEFPIVFVCDCAKPFNMQDAYSNPIISAEYGICIRDVNKAMMAKIPSPAYKKTSELIIRKARSEEMRLLYVAATRAKYKLIFTGKKSNGLENVGTAQSLIDKISYLSWLLVPYVMQYEVTSLPGADNIAPQEETVGALKYRAVSRFSQQSDSDDKICADERISESGDNTDAQSDKEISTASDIIREQISGEYAYKASTEIAAKYTATGLASMKRRDKGEKCELYVSRPSFMQESEGKKLSGKKKGDAYHKLMEHIPFDKAVSEQEAKEYIKGHTADFLSDAERECIKPADISLFFANEVAERMLCSEKIYREFTIFHKLSDNILSEVIEDYQEKNITDGCYVQGIADMFFIEKDGIVLVDYKTDSFSDEEKLTEDYSFQLRVYAEALEKAFSLPVKEMFIYSFKKGKMIKI